MITNCYSKAGRSSMVSSHSSVRRRMMRREKERGQPLNQESQGASDTSLNETMTTSEELERTVSWREVFLYFLLLGFINVGGPVAQITMMYNHMVERRHWLAKERFVQIMAFCHMLPGPEALQIAIYVGYLKRKIWGGILAGLTFILPGAVVM